jgi:hypothetical protein
MTILLFFCKVRWLLIFDHRDPHRQSFVTVVKLDLEPKSSQKARVAEFSSLSCELQRSQRFFLRHPVAAPWNLLCLARPTAFVPVEKAARRHKAAGQACSGTQ